MLLWLCCSTACCCMSHSLTHIKLEFLFFYWYNFSILWDACRPSLLIKTRRQSSCLPCTVKLLGNCDVILKVVNKSRYDLREFFLNLLSSLFQKAGLNTSWHNCCISLVVRNYLITSIITVAPSQQSASISCYYCLPKIVFQLVNSLPKFSNHFVDLRVHVLPTFSNHLVDLLPTLVITL